MWITTIRYRRTSRPDCFWRTFLLAAGLAFLMAGASVLAQPIDLNEDSELKPFDSPEDLLDYLKTRAANGTVQEDMLFGGESDGVMTMADTRLDSTDSLQDAMSPEPGGPLANTVKTDGRYLYIAPYTEIDLSFSLNSEEDTLRSGDMAAGPAIRVFELMDDPPGAIEVGAIGLSNHQMPVSGLHLFADVNGPGESLLATVGNRSPESRYFWSTPGYWRGKSAEVAIYDISAPESPHPVSRLTLEGQLVATRSIGNTLYVVTRFTPSLEGNLPDPQNPSGDEANRQAIEKAGLLDLLPGYAIDDEPQGSLVEAEACYLSPTEDATGSWSGILSVTAVDVTDPRYPRSKCVVGNIETYHMAEDILYLATTRTGSAVPDSLTGLLMERFPDDLPSSEVTDIHKFDLSGNEPAYRGSGTVPGRLAGTQAEKRFAMSAHEDVLRVVTSRPYESDDSNSVTLSLIKEVSHPGSPSSMEEFARLENLELIAGDRFVVRFAAELVYLVGENATMPIRLIDLSDPSQPQIGAELPQSAAIDRLIPVGSGFYVGIGRHEAADGHPGGGGVELSLVNAGDPVDPILVNTLTIGKQGTDSDARFEPQSVYADLRPDGRSARLAVPIQLHGRVEEESDAAPEEVTAEDIGWVHTGLYLFDVFFETDKGRDPGLEPVDILIADRASDVLTATWSLGPKTDRVVVLSDAVYYIHRGNVWSAMWQVPEASSEAK